MIIPPLLHFSQHINHNLYYIQVIEEKKKKTTLQLRPKLLKRIKHRHPLPHRILHLIVHGNQLRHDVENLVEEVAGDGDDSFEGVAEDDVALFGLAYNFVYKKELLQWGVCG